MFRNLLWGWFTISANCRYFTLFILLIIMASCGPKPRTGLDLLVPYDVIVKAQNGKAVIWWNIDRSQNRPISGYNIYLSEKPLKGLFPEWQKTRPQPYNHAPYPGDTDGDLTKESFEITNLENGKTYYVSVRTIGAGGVESDAKKEVSFVPLSKGLFTIASNHTSHDGGFNFESGIPVPVRDPRSDIYIYAKKDVVGMSSPSRLSAGLRKTKFSMGKNKKLETVKIRSGDRLSIKTELGRADVRINEINHKGSDAAVTIEYVFYPESYSK